jgi:hypothetical protein
MGLIADTSYRYLLESSEYPVALSESLVSFLRCLTCRWLSAVFL